jgi:hypothetical protein
MKIYEDWRLTYRTSQIHITRPCKSCGWPTSTKFEWAADFLSTLADVVGREWVENPVCVYCRETMDWP